MSYFSILGLNQDDMASITDEIIKKAYFTEVRKYPPDKQPEKFKELRRAYDVLRNQFERSLYIVLSEDYEALGLYLKSIYTSIASEFLEEAIADLLDLQSKASKDNVEIKILLGKCYIQKQNFGIAIKLFKELYQDHPYRRDIFYYLIESYFWRGFFKKVIEAIDDFTKVNNTSPFLLSMYAKCLKKVKTKLSWSAYVEKSLEDQAHSEYPQALLTAAKMHLVSNELQIAKGYMASLKELLANNPTMVYGEGFCLDAIELYEYSLYDDLSWSIECLDLSFLIEAVYNTQYNSFSKSPFIQIYINKCILKLDSDKEISNNIKSIFGYHHSINLKNEVTYKYELLGVFQAYFEILNGLKKERISANRLKEKHYFLYLQAKDSLEEILNPSLTDKLYETVQSIYDKLKDDGESFIVNGKDVRPFFQMFLNRREHSPSHETPYTREEPKISRNSPCPCGSGKKFKHCCGR